jgi:hypothetical protein
MPRRRNHASDLRGATRIAIDATTGLTDLVEALHVRIASKPVKLGGPLVSGAVNGITGLVYQTIRGVTRAVGRGIDAVLGELVPLLDEMESSPTRDALVAALNGVLGDYLAETANPLAIHMQLRRDGSPLDLGRAALTARVPPPGPRVVLLVHGLCMNDRQWTRDGHDHGAALLRDLGWWPVYLRYNTGLHVSTNGRMLADVLESLAAAWPAPDMELAIVAHSMGGLVARAAHHYGAAGNHAWTRRLRKLIFLGTPHHGAPLERGGNWVDVLLKSTPYSAPFARLGQIRSAGITDLRHGSVLDDDWKGRDRFAHGADQRVPVPLPQGVDCGAIAGTLAKGERAPTSDARRDKLPGDGIVPVASALGHHANPLLTLDFPESSEWIAYSTGHLELLEDRAVYRRIRKWLER